MSDKLFICKACVVLLMLTILFLGCKELPDTTSTVPTTDELVIKEIVIDNNYPDYYIQFTKDNQLAFYNGDDEMLLSIHVDEIVEQILWTREQMEKDCDISSTTTSELNVDISGTMDVIGLDYSQITIDTSRILSICFDDRMYCYSTMGLKSYVSYKKEDK